MSEKRIWPLASLTSASSRRAEANDSLGPPGADTEPSPNARYGVGRRLTSTDPVREMSAPMIALSRASTSARWADQSTRRGATSAADIKATRATATMVKTLRTGKWFPLRLDELPQERLGRPSDVKMPRKYGADNKGTPSSRPRGLANQRGARIESRQNAASSD